MTIQILSFFLSIIILCCFPLTVKANYLTTLQQHAEHLNLAKDQQWLKLLHVSKTLFSLHAESLVTNNHFFLHPQGHVDPQAELNTLLAQLFISLEQDKDSVQCRFPARFLWLQQQLAIDSEQLPQRHCQQLKQWLNELKVNGITLVLPVAYLNNPPSMFGHSFLRLDKAQQSTDLLAYTVNFSAITEQEQGIKFAIKGLFGGYSGQFSLAPYYELLKQYSDIESRDLWEYPLDFNQQEIQYLLLHLWELLPATFDYYFINKNCSFQLLTLLEVARPNLKLSHFFNIDAIPTDTVRILIEESKLLKKRHYRPALVTKLTQKAQLLAPKLQQLAKAIATQTVTVDTPAIIKLEDQAQAQVISLAFDYLSYLNTNKIKHQHTINGSLAHQLLVARSFLPPLDKVEIIPPNFSPDQGHAGNRLHVAYGYEGLDHYVQLGFRWSYHDLSDPEMGFVKGSQVEFFKPSVRYYPDKNQFHFESFELINIQSLPNIDTFTHPLSWQISLASKHFRFSNKQRKVVGELKLGGGASYHTKRGGIFSASALTSLMLAKPFEQYTAIGFGLALYLQQDIIPHYWRAVMDAEMMHYVQGIKQRVYRYGLKQRLTLTKTQALVLDLNYGNEFSEPEFVGQLEWRVYF